jgi:hypothetical protein
MSITSEAHVRTHSNGHPILLLALAKWQVLEAIDHRRERQTRSVRGPAERR